MPVDAGLKFFVFLIICAIGAAVGFMALNISPVISVLIWVCTFILAWLIAAAIRMVAQWQRAIILGESETQIASKFMEAAVMYEKSPTALHLRAMNMLYEGMKDKGSLIIVPSPALETMNLGVTNFASMKAQADASAAAPTVASSPDIFPGTTL